MFFSRQWVQDVFLDLTSISDEMLIGALDRRGISVSISRGILHLSSSRPDLKSIQGFAREAAAALGLPLRAPWEEPETLEEQSIFSLLDADCPADSCLRYSLRLAVDCRETESPDWLLDRLRSCGTEPADIFRDIAACVRMETGQNLRVFDLRQVPEDGLLIRDSFPGELLPGRGGEPISLPAGIPLRSDSNYLALSIAGGEEAPIPRDVRAVVLECGCYRGSSRLFGGTGDPMGTLDALNRACGLIRDCGCGAIAQGCLDSLNYVPQPRFLSYAPTAREAEALKPLGFSVQNNQVEIPSFRPDLRTEEDLKTELLRILPGN